MAPILASLPLLAALIMLQTSIVSRMPLLHGTADLALLAIAAWAINDRVKAALPWAFIGGLLLDFVSAAPIGVYTGGYVIMTLLAILLKQRVWKIPMLAMLLVTFTGTLATHGLSIAALMLTGTALPLIESLNLIILPSLLLNLLLAVPFYFLVGDLAGWLYPVEIEA
jgi:rod shape-determining protein MreD